MEKLKKQDKELAKLPSIKEEDARFRKSESFLRRLIRPRRIEVDLKKLDSARKAVIKKEAKRAKSKRSAKRR
ncbi:hypothetical protein JW898_05640 [Candidatus Woesearchaeota archaeon]|nr:hypothetical protein [Candidatus Woesearchaeota archaeon]